VEATAMMNEKRQRDETSDLGHDPDSLKEGVLAAWQAENPGGSAEQFEAHWAALTDPGRSSDDASEDGEAAILKHRFFEEWIALRPQGTRQQFEEEWQEARAR